MEKAVLDGKNTASKYSYLTSSMNLDKQHATISHNNSNINLHTNKKLNTVKDVRHNANTNNNNFNKYSGKIYHYQEQVLKSQNMSPSMTKSNYSKKTSTTNINSKVASINSNTNKGNLNNKVHHRVASGITAANPLSNKMSSDINSNYLSNSNYKNNYVSNFINPLDSARKQNEKPNLKIKNFFEATKLNNGMKANTDRYNHDVMTKYNFFLIYYIFI